MCYSIIHSPCHPGLVYAFNDLCICITTVFKYVWDVRVYVYACVPTHVNINSRSHAVDRFIPKMRDTYWEAPSLVSITHNLKPQRTGSLKWRERHGLFPRSFYHLESPTAKGSLTNITHVTFKLSNILSPFRAQLHPYTYTLHAARTSYGLQTERTYTDALMKHDSGTTTALAAPSRFTHTNLKATFFFCRANPAVIRFPDTFERSVLPVNFQHRTRSLGLHAEYPIYALAHITNIWLRR